MHRTLQEVGEAAAWAVLRFYKHPGVKEISDMKVFKNTFSGVMVLAKKSGQLWELLEKVLTGAGMPAGFVPPSSHTYFISLWSLQDEELQLDQLAKLIGSGAAMNVWDRDNKDRMNRICLQDMVTLKVAELLTSSGDKRGKKIKEWDDLKLVLPDSTTDLNSSLENVVNLSRNEKVKSIKAHNPGGQVLEAVVALVKKVSGVDVRFVVQLCYNCCHSFSQLHPWQLH
jgi:hypothetical protein